MADNDFSNPTPQFGTAEYAPKPGTDVCKSCKQVIAGQYFRVNGSLACSRCVDQLKQQIPKDTHSVFVRGLAFGFGGAILGLIFYSGFSIILCVSRPALSLFKSKTSFSRLPRSGSKPPLFSPQTPRRPHDFLPRFT